MQIEANKSLASYNSFGFDVRAEYFTSANSVDALHEAVQWSKAQALPFLILGGGSNIVFTRDIAGLVIRMAMRGINATVQQDQVVVKVAAGEPWHELVEYLLEQNIFGLENLALIPGLAGAAPIQNIGAYGVEVCDRLASIDAYNTDTGCVVTIPACDCDFAYRHSMFKTDAGRQFVITAITLNLSTSFTPILTYNGLKDSLAARRIATPDARQVFNTVCAIRKQKLPDPTVIGNAGSFFKNPLINRQLFDALRASYPDLPAFEESPNLFKVPAAWLIDHAGWKGHMFDQVGVHTAQALVLVNYGNGTGQQIAILADKIKQDILQRYGVLLEREPVLY